MSEPPILDAERLTRLRRVDALAVAPDGTWAAVAVARLDSDDAKYVHDLWRVELDGTAREPSPLTRGPSDDRAPDFRRDGALAFLSNRNPRDGAPVEGDDERAQVWILPAGGGEPRPLTDEPLGVQAFRFAADGDALILQAPVLPGVEHADQRESAAVRDKHGPSALHYGRMPVRHWDHWLPEAAPHLIACREDGRERRDLTPDADREHREPEWDVSPDGSRVVVTRARPGDDRVQDVDLIVIDTTTGVARTLAEARLTQHQQPRFAPDGERVACLRWTRSVERCGRGEPWLLEADSGVGRALAPDWELWCHVQDWTEDGSALLVAAEDRGAVPIYRLEVATGAFARLTAEQAGGSHGSVRRVPGARAFAGLRHRLHHPPEPFRCALEPGAKPELLARLSLFDEAEGAAIAGWESFSVEGAGGHPVQSFLLVPAAAQRPVPAICWIHGGPVAQWADGWHWRWNPLVPAAAGYALVLPNPRGSTGFGQDFVEGIWGNRWGEDCYADLGAVFDAVAARPEIDGARMAAMGGSFGGYMTNWIGGNTDRFRALVSHAGLFSISAFSGVTDSPAYWELHMGSSPYDYDGAYDRYSPRARIASWTSPTLVIHGERDFRVPVSEALALFEALQRHGVESELLVFPDENHWIRKPRNIRVWYHRFLEFVGRHLDAGDAA